MGEGREGAVRTMIAGRRGRGDRPVGSEAAQAAYLYVM